MSEFESSVELARVAEEVQTRTQTHEAEVQTYESVQEQMTPPDMAGLIRDMENDDSDGHVDHLV